MNLMISKLRKTIWLSLEVLLLAISLHIGYHTQQHEKGYIESLQATLYGDFAYLVADYYWLRLLAMPLSVPETFYEYARYIITLDQNYIIVYRYAALVLAVYFKDLYKAREILALYKKYNLHSEKEKLTTVLQQIELVINF